MNDTNKHQDPGKALDKGLLSFIETKMMMNRVKKRISFQQNETRSESSWRVMTQIVYNVQFTSSAYSDILFFYFILKDIWEISGA